MNAPKMVPRPPLRLMPPITAAAKIPQYTTSIASSITEQGSEWIFRVAVQSKQLNLATVSYAVKEFGVKKIAILSSNEEAGKSVSATTIIALKQHGLEPATRTLPANLDVSERQAQMPS